MTFSLRNLIGATSGKRVDAAVFKSYSSWPAWLKTVADFTFFPHLSHGLDFLVAVLFYATVWPRILPRAHTFSVDWVAEVCLFNLVACWTLYGFWHSVMYSPKAVGSSGKEVSGTLAQFKYNKVNPYFNGAEGHLAREILFTNLGWQMAAAFTCFMAHVYATGKWGVTTYEPFFSPTNDLRYNAWSVGCVLAVTYWREIHFYWVHRFMHKWGFTGPWKVLDVGQHLYTLVHSLHHKSVNPGPWAGMSMHPVEHFIYFTCTILPLLSAVVPALPPIHIMHHLYAVYHACVAPIGGHDGYDVPGGGGGYHYLHHAALDCNYGVPFPYDFDRAFGSWVEIEWYVATGKNLKYARAYGVALEGAAAGNKQKALEMVAKEFGTTAENIKKGN